MKPEIETLQEAIIAAAHERISRKLHDRSWLELVHEWNETGDSNLETQLHAIHSELAREVAELLGVHFWDERRIAAARKTLIN